MQAIVLNPMKKFKRIRVNAQKTKKREVQKKVMAKKHRAKRLPAGVGKFHRLTAYGQPHSLTVSPFSRIATGGTHVNPFRRKARRIKRTLFIRNPGLARISGMLSPTVLGVKLPIMEALGVVGGITVANVIPNMLPLPEQLKTGIGKYVGSLAVGSLVGYAVSRFVNKDIGRLVILGSFVSVLNEVVQAKVLPAINLAGIGSYTNFLTSSPEEKYLTAGTGVSAYTDYLTSSPVEKLLNSI